MRNRPIQDIFSDLRTTEIPTVEKDEIGDYVIPPPDISKKMKKIGEELLQFIKSLEESFPSEAKAEGLISADDFMPALTKILPQQQDKIIEEKLDRLSDHFQNERHGALSHAALNIAIAVIAKRQSPDDKPSLSIQEIVNTFRINEKMRKIVQKVIPPHENFHPIFKLNEKKEIVLITKGQQLFDNKNIPVTDKLINLAPDDQKFYEANREEINRLVMVSYDENYKKWQNKMKDLEAFVRQYIELNSFKNDQPNSNSIKAMENSLAESTKALSQRYPEFKNATPDTVLKDIGTFYPLIATNIHVPQQKMNIPLLNLLQKIGKEVDLQVSLTTMLSEKAFPKKSRFFSMKRPDYKQWAIHTSEQLLKISISVFNKMDLTNIKNSNQQAIQAFDEISNQVALAFLNNINSKAEFIRNIQCYLALAGECLKRGDHFSTKAILGALSSYSITNTYNKMVTQDKQQDFGNQLKKLNDKVKEEYLNTSQTVVVPYIAFLKADHENVKDNLAPTTKEALQTKFNEKLNFFKNCLNKTKIMNHNLKVGLPTDSARTKINMDRRGTEVRDKLGYARKNPIESSTPISSLRK